MIVNVLFYVFSAILVVTALGVITARNPVHCALFLVAAGLTLIFGVTRVVNFAHGSLYMLGAYIAYSLVATFGRGPLGFWGAVVLAALGRESRASPAPPSTARP